MPSSAVLPDPPPVEEIWLANRMLSVRRIAEGGAPAVFVHGLGGSSLNWTDLAHLMAGRLDSWAVDLPGFGWSPPPRTGDYTPTGHADAVADLITEKIGAPVHLFGNSMGGAVSVALAASMPDLVRSVTLIAPALPGGRITRANMHLPVLAVPGVGERLVARYLRAPADWRARATIEACFGDISRMHPQRMAEAVEEVERRDSLTYAADAFSQSTRGLIRSLMDRGPRSLLAQAERVSAPVLLIYGRLDQLVDLRSVHKVADRFPDARTVVLPDSGHVPQMEHPEMVAGVWRDLIGSPHPRASV
jgi:pimeloyl-ACP methyl ester carboxylesterase